MKHGHILNENHKAFIADYIDGAQLGAGQNDYSLEVRAFESFDIDEINEHLSNSLISGAVILGTELDEEDVAQFFEDTYTYCLYRYPVSTYALRFRGYE